jgi:hypothetical protein
MVSKSRRPQPEQVEGKLIWTVFYLNDTTELCHYFYRLIVNFGIQTKETISISVQNIIHFQDLCLGLFYRSMHTKHS